MMYLLVYWTGLAGLAWTSGLPERPGLCFLLMASQPSESSAGKAVLLIFKVSLLPAQGNVAGKAVGK
jgi:hypothetical protein